MFLPQSRFAAGLINRQDIDALAPAAIGVARCGVAKLEPHFESRSKMQTEPGYAAESRRPPVSNGRAEPVSTTDAGTIAQPSCVAAAVNQPLSERDVSAGDRLARSQRTFRDEQIYRRASVEVLPGHAIGDTCRRSRRGVAVDRRVRRISQRVPLCRSDTVAA
jgi:hypothetical protein